MIKINNVSKFFFKGKPNEIKALQNVSLDLEQGLVMLVGKSGCGKTTLLNIVGGLEKPDCGSITVDGTTISRYQCEQWDKLRNRAIGYVFQNYNLIDELTVYQNLELVLKLAGIDEHTYDERIKYALSLVGMDKYALRHPSSLSGGQQQRVGIARAIVKGAKVIIADEPTGNLDDTNTIAVMELLKGISKHCLVVVVTHEEDLAAFYADRIIRLQDGHIVDDTTGSFDGSIEHRAADHVYLGDMQNQTFKVSSMDVQVYDDGEVPPVKVSIVCQHGRILLKVEGESKVTLVTEGSSIVLDEGKYVARTKEDTDMSVDMNILSVGSGKPRRIFTFGQCFRTAFGAIMSKWGMRRKNPYRLLYTTAIFFVLMLALAGPAFIYDRAANIAVDDHVYAVVATPDPADLPVGVIKLDKMATGGAAIDYSFSKYGQQVSIDASTMCVMPISAVGGSLAKGEVCIDELLFDRLQKEYQFDGLLRSKKDLVGMPLVLSVNSYGWFLPTGQTVKVDDDGTGYVDMAGSKQYYLRIHDVVKRSSPTIYLSDEDYAALPTVHFYAPKGANVEITLLYSNNPKAVRKYAEQKGYTLLDLNANSRANFYKESVLSKLVFIILAGIVVVIQIFSMARLARNEYLGKIKLYAQYRSIGVSRGAIYGKISLESAITSLFTSLRGWAVMSIILLIAGNLQVFRTMRTVGLQLFYYPIWFALACGAFLVLVNQIVNLLSPIRLLAHTPAKLMTKYDI